jgi:hypothetical protein
MENKILSKLIFFNIFIGFISILLTVTPTRINAAWTYPLKMSANKRYLVDQNNSPFLIMGDSPHAVFGNLSLADAEIYFSGRHSLGLNMAWIELFCSDYSSICSGFTSYDGIKPFTGTLSGGQFDLATPNETYFTRVDAMLNLAAKYNIVALLDPTETGGWMDIFRANGVTKARNYGIYLGNRYKNYPNIIWLHGNDFQTWTTTSDDDIIRAVADGIKSVDPNHIQTLELEFNNCDSATGYGSGSLDDSTWTSYLSLNSAYTYCSVYDRMLKEYNRTNYVPVYLVESVYEYQGYQGGYSGPHELRTQEYWSQLSGSTGQLYGNANLYPFPSGWKTTDWNTSPGINQFKIETDFFNSFPWYNLVPDQNHSVVTSGYGTYNATAGFGNTSDYTTTAKTADNTLIISYMPTKRTITVDMTKLAGSATARWFDPANGTYTTISGSPFANTGTHQFTPTGNNSGGDGDWVLVLNTGTTQPTITPTLTASITPTLIPKPGDANGDNIIDGRDYVVWLNNYGKSLLGPTNGDFDKNNIVDGRDYVLWLNNYGK